MVGADVPARSRPSTCSIHFASLRRTVSPGAWYQAFAKHMQTLRLHLRAELIRVLVERAQETLEIVRDLRIGPPGARGHAAGCQLAQLTRGSVATQLAALLDQLV